MHSDGKKRRSFLALLFAAGDLHYVQQGENEMKVNLSLFSLNGGETNYKIKLFLAFILLFFISSCSYMFNPTIYIGSKRLYEGPKKNVNRTATLLVYRDGTSLISVNDQDVRYSLGRGLKMDIIPGQYKLTVSFHISSRVVDDKKVTINTTSSDAAYNLFFNAEAGHIYRVVSIIDDTPEKSWTAYLYDITEAGYPTRLVEMLTERTKGTLIAKYQN